MLSALSIRNIVLIEKLDLSWGHGLHTLTGETGAGKSILLDALGLALGARGDAKLVRHGAAQASVSATFDISANMDVQTLLTQNELLAPDAEMTELILRRVQNTDGRSRAFCNDMPISSGLLRVIGDALIEIHGQHESQSLTDAISQLRLLDDYAGLGEDVAKLGALYNARKLAREELTAFREQAARGAQEAEFLRHALDEITQLAPKAEEAKTLADERNLLINMDKITSGLAELYDLLQGETGGEAIMVQAVKKSAQLVSLAQSRVEHIEQALERARLEIADASSQVSALLSGFTHEPGRLEIVEDRLFALRGLARKHNVTVDELPRLVETLTATYNAIENSDVVLHDLETKCTQAEDAYAVAAQAVCEKRRAAAKTLDAAVNRELPALKLEDGRFVTHIEQLAVADGRADGLDKVSFQVATNKGMAAGALAKIASGGELARFMLALKVSLARGRAVRSLIFDEVDAGVGGAVAEAVGVRLHKLAQGGQVLVVTHSPQVAAQGDHHWRVEKSGGDDGVVSDVIVLDDAARVDEVARMLAGAKITLEARAAAKALIEG